MKRLFTFGCSFTQYWRWPTWADALGQQSKSFENWGICGGGNAQILYNLMECNQRNRLTSHDTVMVMWTNTSREDRYVKDRWFEGGNIYWSAGSQIPAEYVRKFSCERGYLIRDLAIVAAVKKILDGIGCEYRFFSMVPLCQSNRENQLGEDPQDSYQLDDVYNLYRDLFEHIAPSVLETVFKGSWFSGTGISDDFDSKRRDFHPTPMEHLEYLAQVAPEIKINNDTRDWMNQWQDDITYKKQIWHPQHLPVRL